MPGLPSSCNLLPATRRAAAAGVRIARRGVGPRPLLISLIFAPNGQFIRRSHPRHRLASEPLTPPDVRYGRACAELALEGLRTSREEPSFSPPSFVFAPLSRPTFLHVLRLIAFFFHSIELPSFYALSALFNLLSCNAH